MFSGGYSFDVKTVQSTASKKTIAPGKGAAADLPEPKVGKLVQEGLYVEYSF